MDIITTTHVDYRRHQLRELAASLRWERGRAPSRWLRSVRVALGRRLVRAGTALLGDARSPAVIAR
jgi:hypothetical protein